MRIPGKLGRILLLCFIIRASGVIAAESVARLAILADSEETTGLSDLLLVQLSLQPGVVMIERDQVDRVIREQSLSAVQRDYLKLGQLLGADGMLVLTLQRDGTNRLLQTRLVATKPGVVLVDLRTPWPVGKTAEWAEGLARHLKPMFPKLTVLPKDAVPISVLNLRSAVRTSTAQSIEQELTLLLIHRLTQQREVFVLERQYLGELQREKELTWDESPFWTGRYLLDGLLDPDGFNPTQTKLQVRLSAPGGATVATWELSGARTNLAAMVEPLVGKILEGLKLRMAQSQWRPMEEAKQYGEEAKWALRWGLLREAQAASDSAWALGLQTREVALLRIRSYASGIPMGYWGSNTKFERLPPMPDSAKLRPMTRALELLADALPRFASTNLNEEAEWLKTGTDTINQASGLLENYHRLVEARLGFEEQLAELRSQVRQAMQVMPTNLMQMVRAGRHRITSVYQQWQLVSDWQKLRWNAGGLWNERPEAAALVFHQVLREGWYPSAVAFPMGLPRFAAWSWNDRKKIPQLEQNFIEELKRSDDPDVRLEGFYLSILNEVPEPVGQLKASTIAWMDEVWRQRQRLYEGQRGQDIQSEEVLLSLPVALEKKFGNRLQAPEIWSVWEQFLIRLRTDYLTQSSVLSYDGFRAIFPDRSDAALTETAAQQLLPLFEPFGRRFPDAPRQMVQYVNQRSNAIAASVSSAAATPVGVAALETNQPIERLIVDLVPLRLPWKSGAFAPLGPALYRNGKFWFLAFQHNEFFAQGVRLGPAAIFVVVDPQTGRQEQLPLPEEFSGAHWAFEVTEAALYATTANRILLYDLQEKRWDSVEAPIPEGARIQQFAGRFFLTTADSILGFDPTNRSIQVLASTRRRPALNPLDEVEGNRSYDFAEIFETSLNQVGVLVRNRFFVRPQGAGEWQERPLAFDTNKKSPKNIKTVGPRLLSEYSPYQGGRSQCLWEISANNEAILLFENYERFGGVRRNPALASPFWQWPEGYGFLDGFFTVDGDACWALVPYSPWRSRFNLERMVLFRFEPGWERPLMLELQFEADAKPADLGNIVPTQGPRLSFLNVPQGILITSRRELGYWLIPHALINAKFQAQRASRPATPTRSPAPTHSRP